MTEIDQNTVEAVFDDDVRELVFADARRPQAGRPRLILLGGQPAAGKSSAQDMLLNRFASANPVPITGDDFRRFHPDYHEAMRTDQLSMPNVTATLSGPLVARCLDEALDNRYSVLLEGTFRDSHMVLGTVQRFSEAGYAVDVAAVATRPEVSRLSAEKRYLDAGPDQARWTPPTAHDASYEAMPETLARLEEDPRVDTVSVFTRNDEVYFNERTDSGEWAHEPESVDVLRTEQSRPLTPEQSQEWLEDFEDVRQDAFDRPGYLQERTVPAWRSLVDDAGRVAATAGVTAVVTHAAVQSWTGTLDTAAQRHDVLVAGVAAVAGGTNHRQSVKDAAARIRERTDSRDQPASRREHRGGPTPGPDVGGPHHWL